MFNTYALRRLLGCPLYMLTHVKIIHARVKSVGDPDFCNVTDRPQLLVLESQNSCCLSSCPRFRRIFSRKLSSALTTFCVALLCKVSIGTLSEASARYLLYYKFLNTRPLHYTVAVHMARRFLISIRSWFPERSLVWLIGSMSLARVHQNSSAY